MRLLGSNLLPFSVAQLPATWSTGLEVEAYFFEGDIPSDISQYFLDQRKLIENCVAASRIVLQPMSQGLMFHQTYSHGVKAVAGSVYDPKLGVTIHYPKNIIPRRTTASTTTMDIDTAYAVDLMTGNKKLKQHISLALFPGFPINAVRTLTDFVGNTGAQIATVADMVFDGLKTFDGALSDTPEKIVAGALQIIAGTTATAGATASGTTVNLTVPINLSTNAAPSAITTDVLRAVGTTNARRTLPVSIGDKSTTPVTKTVGHAILVIPDSNNGALAVGNYDIRLCATKVGLKGSGELIEVDSLAVSTGEFVEVIQVRTSKGSTKPNDPLAWIAADAIVAFDGSIMSSPSPTTDYKNNVLTYTGWPVQSDQSIKGILGSVITIPETTPIDFTKSFYIECDWRQDDTASLAEMNLAQVQNSLQDRFILSFDRSNETGLCIWNNSQGPRVSRPLSTFAALRSLTFVHLLYQYDSDTGLHTVKVDGVLIDSFTYAVQGYTKKPIMFMGSYGGASIPNAYLRNVQMVQGKKPNRPTVVTESGIYSVKDTLSGTVSNAYIEKDSDGNNWLLIASWVNFQGTKRTFEQTIQQNKTVVPLDEAADPAYPCFSGQFLNNATDWKFTSDRAGWVALYGAYMNGKTFASSKTQIAIAEPIPVSTPLGDKSVYGGQSPWSLPTYMTDPFGFMTHADNSGPCGGASKTGTDKICPIMGGTAAAVNHCDGTGKKHLLLKLPYTFDVIAKV